MNFYAGSIMAVGTIASTLSIMTDSYFPMVDPSKTVWTCDYCWAENTEIGECYRCGAPKMAKVNTNPWYHPDSGLEYYNEDKDENEVSRWKRLWKK